jgi:hypothetical protein
MVSATGSWERQCTNSLNLRGTLSIYYWIEKLINMDIFYHFPIRIYLRMVFISWIRPTTRTNRFILIPMAGGISIMIATLSIIQVESFSAWYW